MDNNHTINKDELHHYWRTAAKSSLTHRFVENIWTKLDKDVNSEITIDEFMAAAGVGKEWKLASASIDKEADIAVQMSVKPLQTLLMAQPKLLLKVSRFPLVSIERSW